MSQSLQIETLREEFHPAIEQFISLARQLEDEKANKMEHGQIEDLIFKDGTEVLRLLFQAHIDLRCGREERKESLKGSDGIVRTHCRNGCECGLMTIFGQVTAKRKGYSVPRVSSIFPLDGELNLFEDKYSSGLRHRVANEVASHSFDEGVANIEKTTGGKVPKRQAEEVVVRAAQDFEGFYSNRATQGSEQTKDILVMTVDQKGIVMRKEDLRPATQKAAEKTESLPAARLTPGEKPNRKRMSTVAAVYTVEPHERTPEMIMGNSPDEKRPAQPQCRNKRVWASVEQNPEKVIQAMLDEALRRDPEMKRPWAVLLDGGEKQLDNVLKIIWYHQPEVIIILDFIHVLEYLWKAAYSFFPVGSTEAEQWVSKRALKILQGKSGKIVKELNRNACLIQLSDEKRKAVKKCADYLDKYEPFLRYDNFLKEGLPIATGVIEGACRHLIKDRMDLTGARWRLKRAEAVLRIRSLRSSGDLDAYWAFHSAQEQKRNHSYGLSRAA